MMKNPHMTFICIMLSLSAFVACDKAALESSVSLADQETEPRCCDEIGDNPLFHDVYDDMRIGLIEPVQDIIEALHPDYIDYLVFQYDKCIDNGNDPLTCIDQFFDQLGIKMYLDHINHALFDSLRLQYPDLSDKEFQDQFVDAILNESGTYDRELPCYAAFESKVIRVFTDIMMPTADPFWTIRRIRDLLDAYNDFCNCIYNTYDRPC